MFKAIATIERDGKQWDVTIYHYDSIKEAQDGINRFSANYEGTDIHVIDTRIIRNS